MLPNFMMIDDFVKYPLALRKEALAANYDPALKNGNYPGLMSQHAVPITGLDDAVSHIINAPVKAAPNTVHGHCRLTLKGDKGRSGVHIDPCFYSGILYLSLPEHCKGGTDFFRHRRTGLERVPTNEVDMMKAGYRDPNMLIEDVVNKDTTSPGKWERVFRAPMKFNRLILFSPWMFHNAGPAFGTSDETGRLAYLMFFASRN